MEWVDQPQLFSLTLPAGDGLIGLARAVMSALGAHLGMTYEEIDDLRLAIDEASSVLLQAAPSARTIRVTASWDEGGLESEVAVDSEIWPWPPVDRTTLPWMLIEKLAERPEATASDIGSSIRFTKRRGEVVGDIKA
jgi:serine/threonine-protein kinase RsbW